MMRHSQGIPKRRIQRRVQNDEEMRACYLGVWRHMTYEAITQHANHGRVDDASSRCFPGCGHVGVGGGGDPALNPFPLLCRPSAAPLSRQRNQPKAFRKCYDYDGLVPAFRTNTTSRFLRNVLPYLTMFTQCFIAVESYFPM